MAGEREQQHAGGGVERRAHQRWAVDLRATVDVDGRDSRWARIQDFCVGGLFLRVEGQEDDYLVMAARQIGRDDRLRVTFQADDGSGFRTYVVQVKVARLFLGGMGVAFDPPEPAAIRALQREAERTRAAKEASQAAVPGAPASAAAQETLAAVRQRLERWLREQLDALFKQAAEGLFIEARDAASNDVQTECMDAMKDVERVAAGVRDGTVESMLRVFDKLSPGSTASLSGSAGDAGSASEGLSLVDTGSFDDWVTAKNIMSRHEPKLREEAYALARRLSVLSGKPVDEEANPAGVQQLCSDFNESMQNLGLVRRARKAIYHHLEHGPVMHLGELHQRLNALLVERGVLPSVERPVPGTPKRAPRAPAPQPEEIAPEPTPEESPPDDTGQPWATGGAATSAPRAGARVPGAYPPPGQGHGGAAPGQYPGRGPGAAPGPEPGAGSRTYSDTAWAPHPDSGAAPHPGSDMAPAPGPPPPAPGWQAPAGEAAGRPAPAGDPAAGWQAPAGEAGGRPVPASGPATTSVPGRPGYRSPIQPRVPQVAMAQAYQAARSLMNLRRAMTSGAPVSAAAAESPMPAAEVGPSPDLMRALQELQSAPEFASPAPRQPLNLRQRLRESLARDGISLSSEESEAVDVLTSIIEAVLVDPLIQEPVKPRIQRLSVPLLKVALQDQAFFAQEAHPARQVVNRLGMLGLPESLAEGEIGDSLKGSVDPLLDRIVGDANAGPAEFEAVLPELDGLVERQNRRFTENVGSIVETRERQQAMLAGRRQAPAQPRRVAPELEPWFKRTRRLKVGDVVTFKAGTDEPEPRTLAWVADDFETFVFADRTGRQSASVAQQELALELLRGSAKVLDSPDVPAMDRGVYQMLHEMHRSLSEEGRKDAVTGLMPLSAFQARVEEAIGRAQRRGSKHALLALNLDGFKAINDRCGRKAGDSLLRKLSRLLSRQIEGQGCITRSYADEFLLLLEDQSFQDARRFAERQCRAVDNSRVVFEGEQYPITASIGLVPVTRAGDSAEALIDSARAALAGAKRRGGNQLRVFDPDEDRVPAEHAEADEEAAADAAGGDLGELLNSGRLLLQRQAVNPIAQDSDLKPHFAVRLAMRGDDGTVTSVPADLVTEAERGERMAEVDRWIIRAALAWMKANRREVVRGGGFAIRLSGATFADEGLLAYVVAELTESTVPPAKVIFAVPEAVAIDRLSTAVDFIRNLREYGCRFAIADFGAGHSTFSYLKTLPVEFVNIDGIFVRDLAENDSDVAMVKSINEISHLMGKHTVAEYVDSEPVRARIAELGVDFGQGDALAAPETLE